MDHLQGEKISKALADETRLMIFEAIATREQMNCGEIVSSQGVTPATVSHHLRVLAEAGLIDSHREGQCVYGRAIPETIEEYVRALSHMARGKKLSGARRMSSLLCNCALVLCPPTNP